MGLSALNGLASDFALPLKLDSKHPVTSSDSDLSLRLQADGNVVLYRGTVALWDSNTVNADKFFCQSHSCEAVFSKDGTIRVTQNELEIKKTLENTGGASFLRLSEVAPFISLRTTTGANLWSGCLKPENNSAIGDEVAINLGFRQGGAGTKIALCGGINYRLLDGILFTAPDQSLYSDQLWSPKKAKLTVTSSGLFSAIGTKKTDLVSGEILEACTNCSRVKIAYLEVDGQARRFGQMSQLDENGHRLARPTLISLGGTHSVGQEVSYVSAYDARGWSHLYFDGGVGQSCTGAKIEHNIIGMAGLTLPGNPPHPNQIDGISLGCPDSLIHANEVIDATDAAIVLFYTPGTTVSHNTIKNLTKAVYGGINLVDVPHVYVQSTDENGNPVSKLSLTNSGDYAGVLIKNNILDARGAAIKVGIAVGPHTWSTSNPYDPDHPDLRYITGDESTQAGRGHIRIKNNVMKGSHFGFGIMANSARYVDFINNEYRAGFFHGNLMCQGSWLNYRDEQKMVYVFGNSDNTKHITLSMHENDISRGLAATRRNAYHGYCVQPL